jgi:hypothetical protein
MTIGKSSFHNVTSVFSPASIVARLRNIVKYEIPIGYQDESGFHMGVKPADNEIKWPAAW